MKPKATDMVLDMGFVLEGHSDDELPERMLACARCDCPPCGSLPRLAGDGKGPIDRRTDGEEWTYGRTDEKGWKDGQRETARSSRVDVNARTRMDVSEQTDGQDR